MTPQTQRKPSFFRRLSSSAPSTASMDNGHGSPVIRSSKRTVSGPGSKWSGTGLGGPAYEAMPVGASPSAYSAGDIKDGLITRRSIIKERGKLVKETALPLPTNSLTYNGHASPNRRHTIYPALASPPSSPPRQLDASSPYAAVGLPRPSVRNGPAMSNGQTARREPSFGTTTASQFLATEYSPSRTVLPSTPPQPSPSRDLHRSNSRYADADLQAGSTPPLTVRTESAVTLRVVSSRRSTRDPTVTTSQSFKNNATGVSEASAYAKAISSTMVTTPPVKQERRVSRPLPRPPSLPASSSQASIHVIATSRNRGAERQAVIEKLATPEPMSFDFPRSPTLPPLNDPRQEKNPIDTWAGPVAASQLPVRKTSTMQARPVTPPGPTLVTGPPRGAIANGSTLRVSPPPPCNFVPTLAFVLGIERVQNALLPLLPINSFLSLTGSSDVVRKRFSGEVVGRWILKEWGITLGKEKGRSWPNLTVWEGFLESLLHDPATYSTYPAQWHSLLQHLSLSYTLVVLHLRNLPSTSFPNSTPLPFEEDNLPFSNSIGSLFSVNLPRSRMGSTAGSDVGSIAPGKMPRQERVMEVIMPEPLASIPSGPEEPVIVPRKPRRRGSIGSLASATLSFGRRRAGSSASERPELSLSAPMAPSGKAALPPVSYPSAKRYNFTRHGDPTAPRTRTSSESSRPGSVFSVQSTNSVATSYRPGVSRQPLVMTNFLANPRASLASSPSSIYGGHSPVQSRFKRNTPSPRREPAFDLPPPYAPGRVPVLRVFVPLSDKVRRWPSAEGALATAKELDKSGASRRLRLGDLVVNTAIRQPKTTEHVLLFVPFVKHLFVPLEYTHSIMGHLPRYVDAFALAPSYFYPFLPTPQIVYLNLGPYSGQITRSLRLAHDRRDVVVSSGAKLSAKRYLHVAGFEVQSGGNVAPEWQGTVSLEAEGTAEGKQGIEWRAQGGLFPWEVIREKSMTGVVWLRLIKEAQEELI